MPSTLAGEGARTLIVFSGSIVIPDIPENYRTHVESYRAETRKVTATDRITLKLAPGGGACILLRTAREQTE